MKLLTEIPALRLARSRLTDFKFFTHRSRSSNIENWGPDCAVLSSYRAACGGQCRTGSAMRGHGMSEYTAGGIRVLCAGAKIVITFGPYRPKPWLIVTVGLAHMKP